VTEESTSELERLMASIGYLMLHWSWLEGELEEDIRRLRTEIEGPASFIRVRGSFSDWLREWRGLLSQKTRRRPELAAAVSELANEMEQLRRKRNLVAHDFASASALPEDGEPFILCAPRERSTLNAEPTRITQSDLTRTIEAIERCRARIRRVTVEETL
jgi:hypothetical protein